MYFNGTETVDPDYKTLTFTYQNDYPIVATDNLVAHYKFNGDFTDSTGNNANAVPNGTGGIAELVTTHKKIGDYSLKLLSDPSPQTYVSLPSFQFGDVVSISFWFNWNLATSSDSNHQKIIFLKKNGTGDRIFIGRDSTNKRIYFTVDCDNKTRKDYKIYNTTIQDDTWYHIVWVIDNTYEWKVYVNGVYEAPSNSVSGTAGQLDTTIIFDENYIGRHGTDNYDNWDGYLDDFRIYNKVLTQQEVTELYNVEITNYSLTFDNPTEGDILIIDSIGIEHTSQTIPQTVNITVGSVSTVNSLTTSGGTSIISSFITGSSISYSSPIVIIRYKITTTTSFPPTTTEITPRGILKYNTNNEWSLSTISHTDIHDLDQNSLIMELYNEIVLLKSRVAALESS